MTTAGSKIWRPEDSHDVEALAASIRQERGQNVYRPEIHDVIDATIDALSDELRALSLDIHDHPELKFEEKHAHDVLASFMSKQNFQVTTHYHLPTAWKATYTHGNGGQRTIGINSEMDALPGIGHACGHNLIGMAGVAVACAMKVAMEKFNIAGKIVLLGTPGEEGGNGKDILLKHGAYKEMDICLMCHPAPGPHSSVSLSSSLALCRSQVEYFGHTAHAALSPWEGQNALDAAVLAYTNVSLLRQQVKPSHRIHGIFEGKDWTPNIIPDYAKMLWIVRGPTIAEAKETHERVQKCLKAASIASGCKVKINNDFYVGYDLRQNATLGGELSDIVNNRHGFIDYEYGIASASTDFGAVTYALPALHPGFAIPSVKDGGNHTTAFTEAARTIQAHIASLNVSKALAGVGIRVLTDEAFFKMVKETFEEDKKHRGLD
jgi:amidohydrolase